MLDMNEWYDDSPMFPTAEAALLAAAAQIRPSMPSDFQARVVWELLQRKAQKG